MKTAIAIRHVCFEDLGTLEPLLQTRGYTVRYVDAAVDDLHALDVASPDLMIVLGGPSGLSMMPCTHSSPLKWH